MTDARRSAGWYIELLGPEMVRGIVHDDGHVGEVLYGTLLTEDELRELAASPEPRGKRYIHERPWVPFGLVAGE